jgi:hypothetical protein
MYLEDYLASIEGSKEVTTVFGKPNTRTAGLALWIIVKVPKEPTDVYLEDATFEQDGNGRYVKVTK